MPTVTIRQLSDAEAPEVMYPLTSYAFSPSPPLRDKAEFMAGAQLRRGATVVAAFEDERAVAVVAATAMTQNVRGRLFGASAIWGIASHPATRRQGYVRRALAETLAITRAAGQPLSGLYPFRESFYERLGYVTFPRAYLAKLSPAALAPLLHHDFAGHVELLSIADGYDAFRAYALQQRSRMHGMAVFDLPEKEAAIRRNDVWVALAMAGGETVGAMTYNLRNEGGSGMTLKAHRFYYDTSQGRYLLLQWIARHTDQAGQAEILLPPAERPETWWPDLRMTVEFTGGGPMARVVDVAALDGMPVFADPVGRDTVVPTITVHLTDPLCPWNTGTWRFEASDGKLTVRYASDAEGTLTIQGLTGLVFGTHDPADFAVRGWGQPSAGTQQTLRTLFPPMLPYMHETF